MYDIESSNNFDKNIANVKLKEQLFISYSPVLNILSKQHLRKSLKEKNIKSRAMYSLRKKTLDCEERRVAAINKLSEKIEAHNKIQQERNDILRNLILHENTENNHYVKYIRTNKYIYIIRINK